MDYKIEDLIDMQLFQSLQDKLSDIDSFTMAILDNESKIHTATAWQDICTKFHRVNPDSCKECIKSDQYILDHIHEGNPAVTYNCSNGLMDSATPIIIEGKHLATFFIGQFFLKPPNIEFFKTQAKKYGFDEKSYMEAVAKVPVWSQDQLNKYLAFIKKFTEALANMGLARLREKESLRHINEANQFTNQIINDVHEGIVVYNPDMTYKVWNPFMERLSGISATDVLGKHPLEVFPFLKDVGVIGSIEDALAGKVSKALDFPFEIPATGRSGWVSDISSPLFGTGGSVIGAIGTISDNTERKLADENLDLKAQLLDSATDSILLHTFEGKFVYVNEAAFISRGYTRNELLGMKLQQLDAPGPRELIGPRIKELEDTGEASFESTHLCKDGSEMPVEVHARVIESSGQKLVLSICRDISNRKQAEAAQENLRDKAEMSSRLATVGEMAAGIAHEINNPLTGVIGFSELLMEQDVSPEIKEQLKIINDGSIRVKDIVKRMLTFARQNKPMKISVSIHELIDATLEIRGYVLKTANIEVVKDYDPDLPWITADPGQLQQVFLNLIVNAEHAMKKAHGKGSLTVTSLRTDDHVRLIFKDDGPGMTEEVKAKLFQPFFTTKDPGEGTGLGLSVSHSIILEHNGTIEVESKLGIGTSFVIELPIASTSESETETPTVVPVT